MKKGRKMPSSEGFRKKAQQCLDMAARETTDSVAAMLLRMVAEDYLDLAEKEAAGQQQQQIQSEKPEEP
jgi:hypothetical protein